MRVFVVMCVFVRMKVLLRNKIINKTDKSNWVQEFGERVETNWSWKTSEATGENHIGKLPVRCCIMSFVMYYIKT